MYPFDAQLSTVVERETPASRTGISASALRSLSGMGATFQKLYARMGNPTKPAASEEIDRAFAGLPPGERQAFRTAAGVVPDTYRPDRVIVVYAPPPGRAPSHHEEGAAEERPQAPPAATPPERAEPEPERSETAAPPEKPGPLARVRSSGKYQVTLTTDPDPPVAGRETDIEVKVVQAAAPDARPEDEAPLARATVRGWFVPEGQEPSTVVLRRAHAEEEEGVYGWHYPFPEAGSYRLIVEVAPDEGKKFTVQFPVTVGGGPAGPKEREQMGPSEERDPSPRDRVRAEVTQDGYIETAWLGTEPPINFVPFTLLGKEGKELATQTVTAAPFAVRFPRRARSYFSDGLAQVQAAVEYTGGVKTEVIVPFRKPAAGGSVGGER
jgi:hypothetical protein